MINFYDNETKKASKVKRIICLYKNLTINNVNDSWIGLYKL